MPDPPKAILLTGAGFTHNFGGYLARDMWAQIFSQEAVRRHATVQRAMRNSFNFETAYDEILYGQFSEAEKNGIIEGVTAAFADLDEIVKGFTETASPISLNSLARFIERFAGTPSNPGYVFTLNQDLFFERQLPLDGILAALPGLQAKQEDRFNRNTFRQRALDSIRLQLPDLGAVQRFEAEHPKRSPHLMYVKLHGSTDWLSHDGASRPVIGRQKTRLIEQEPLLTWYSRLFQRAVTMPTNRKLLAVGYGFEDPHINEVLRVACADHGLKFCVVDPAPPEHLWQKLRNWSDQSWRGWAGYYRCTLPDLFGRSGLMAPGEVALRNLLRSVFATP
jgi:hypothetical protein